MPARAGPGLAEEIGDDNAKGMMTAGGGAAFVKAAGGDDDAKGSGGVIASGVESFGIAFGVVASIGLKDGEPAPETVEAFPKMPVQVVPAATD